LRRSRQNNSTSPITSTLALFASTTDQCGAGWVNGTPGVSSSDDIVDQSILRRSWLAMPAARALSTLGGAVIERDHVGTAGDQSLRTREPRAADPNTATFFPAKLVTGIIAA